MFSSLCLLPTALVVLCDFSIAASLVLVATLFVVTIVIINQSFTEESFGFIRARKMHASIGAVIALSETVAKIPPTIAIIIAIGLFIIGLFQIIREDSLFGFDFHKKWNDELLGIIPNTFILLSALFSGLMVVAHFGDQSIWIPLIALGFLIIASIRLYVFDLCKFDEKALQIFILAITSIIGIISTVIQFNEARIFGILIWVITLVIGILLILTLVFLYFRAIVRERKRKELEKAAAEEKIVKEEKDKEMLRQHLIEKAPDLSWKEIWTGFNKVYESFGIELFLSSPDLNKLSDLVTISNEKAQIFWSIDLSRMFQIMESAARKVQDDENLRKILDVCTSIEDFVETKKSKSDGNYKGESELRTRLYTIRGLIKS